MFKVVNDNISGRNRKRAVQSRLADGENLSASGNGSRAVGSIIGRNDVINGAAARGATAFIVCNKQIV